MALLKALSKVAKRVRRTAEPLRRHERGSEFDDPDGTKWQRSRWDLLKNNCNNRHRWTNTDGLSINNDLNLDLTGLMARCDQEYARNSIFQGVVNTFKRDVVGPYGPTLQIISDDKQFNAEVERQVRGIFAMPNPSRPTSGGVEAMKQWVHLLSTAGSFLNVFTEPRRDDLVSFGWKTIHPRRLLTPMQYIGDPDVAFGIRIDPSTGEPTRYYLDKPRRIGGQEFTGFDFEELRPEQVQHRFIETEPEQITGFPMMASTLDAAADIRELDDAEIKAQRRNAAHSLGLQAHDPASAVDPEPIDGTTYEFSDDEVNVAPIGWSWQSLDNNRPSPDHINYRRERMAEIGRPVGMPLLIILLTVADVNFSSAQFGGMLYAECIRDVQSFLERMTLNELVELIILELVISGKVRRPKEYQKVWTHHVPPNANMEKFAKTLRTLIEDGVISRSIATAWLGFDPEEVDSQRQTENERADGLGISRPPVNEGRTNPADTLREVADGLETEPENEDAADTVTA